MGNVSREEILRKNQKEMLEIKKHCNRNEECLNGLSSKLDMIDKRIFELKDILIESSETEKKIDLKEKGQSIQDLWDTLKRCKICIMGIPEGE